MIRAGLAAEFADAGALIAAIERVRALGYRRLDACTPYPLVEVDDALRVPRSWLNWIVFPCGVASALFGFWVLWFCNAWSYPLDVGGRPPFAIPAFIPITFEAGVLGTAVVAFVTLFALARLPHLTHPLFEVDGFERCSIDRFWLLVDAADLDGERTAHELEALGALRVATFGGAS